MLPLNCPFYYINIYNCAKGPILVVWLPSFLTQNQSVLCHMGDFACGEGGWIPVMKIDCRKVLLIFFFHHFLVIHYLYSLKYSYFNVTRFLSTQFYLLLSKILFLKKCFDMPSLVHYVVKLDQYQYLGRRRYVTEPFKFTKKRLI